MVGFVFLLFVCGVCCWGVLLVQMVDTHTHTYLDVWVHRERVGGVVGVEIQAVDGLCGHCREEHLFCL